MDGERCLAGMVEGNRSEIAPSHTHSHMHMHASTSIDLCNNL